MAGQQRDIVHGKSITVQRTDTDVLAQIADTVGRRLGRLLSGQAADIRSQRGGDIAHTLQAGRDIIFHHAGQNLRAGNAVRDMVLRAELMGDAVPKPQARV